MLDVADAIEANEKLIVTENEADVAAAELAGYEKPLVARLALKPGKVFIISSDMSIECFYVFFFLILFTIFWLSKLLIYLQRICVTPLMFFRSGFLLNFVFLPFPE